MESIIFISVIMSSLVVLISFVVTVRQGRLLVMAAHPEVSENFYSEPEYRNSFYGKVPESRVFTSIPGNL